jgi:hypothetical protein
VGANGEVAASNALLRFRIVTCRWGCATLRHTCTWAESPGAAPAVPEASRKFTGTPVISQVCLSSPATVHETQRIIATCPWRRFCRKCMELTALGTANTCHDPSLGSRPRQHWYGDGMDQGGCSAVGILRLCDVISLICRERKKSILVIDRSGVRWIRAMCCPKIAHGNSGGLANARYVYRRARQPRQNHPPTASSNTCPPLARGSDAATS